MGCCCSSEAEEEDFLKKKPLISHVDVSTETVPSLSGDSVVNLGLAPPAPPPPPPQMQAAETQKPLRDSLTIDTLLNTYAKKADGDSDRDRDGWDLSLPGQGETGVHTPHLKYYLEKSATVRDLNGRTAEQAEAEEAESHHGEVLKSVKVKWGNAKLKVKSVVRLQGGVSGSSIDDDETESTDVDDEGTQGKTPRSIREKIREKRRRYWKRQTSGEE